MNIRSEQEQEHFDHVAGSASEFQNCFAEAGMVRARLASEGSARINALLAAGRFVVVEESPYYCKATDAVAGMVKDVVSHHASREEAEAAAAPRAEVMERYGDGYVCVLPALPVRPLDASDAPAVCPADDAVPF